MAAITWSVYNLIPGKWRLLVFDKNYGKIPVFPAIYFSLLRLDSFLVGEPLEPVAAKKLSIEKSDDKELIRSPFKHYLPNLFLGCAIIGLTFVFPLFVPMGVVIVALVRILDKEHYKAIGKRALKYMKYYILVILPSIVMMFLWIIWKFLTSYDFFYFRFTHLVFVSVNKRNFLDDGYYVEKNYKIEKRENDKNERIELFHANNLEYTFRNRLNHFSFISSLRWKGAFFIAINLSLIVLWIWSKIIKLIWVIIPGAFATPMHEEDRSRSRSKPEEERDSGCLVFLLFQAFKLAISLFVTFVAGSIILGIWFGLGYLLYYLALGIGAIGGFILVGFAALFLAIFFFFPLSALFVLLLLFYWLSLQLRYLSIAVIVALTFVGCIGIGLYIAQKIRQYIRVRNDSIEEPKKYDLALLNGSRHARKYLELTDRSAEIESDDKDEITIELTARDIEEAAEKYDYYFDEVETRAWIRKKPVGIFVGLLIFCSAGMASFVVATNSSLDEIVAPSYDNFIEFLEDSRDTIVDLFQEPSLPDFSRDGSGTVDSVPTTTLPPATTVAPTTTTEPFRFVEGEGDCIQGEEFFFGGGCIPCETNPSQPACQIDASATRDLECSIAEFEFGGGCVPCSVNPQACAPPGLECAADEFIFGGGCVPCAVDPDSCGDGQTGPATEGVSYTGVLRDGQTRAPPVFASGITGRSKYGNVFS